MPWSLWTCPKCVQEVELHDLSPLEAWCVRCMRSLEAIADDEEIDE